MLWNPLDPMTWLAKLREKAPSPQEAATAALGTLDATAAMGSALPGMALAGAAALPWTVIPGETKAADVFENVLSKMPRYEPRTEYGKAQLEGLSAPGGVGEKIDKPFRWVGDRANDAANALGLPAEVGGLAGSLAYSAANLVGPVEAAQAAKALPGIVARSADEAIMGGATSKVWAGRVQPEKRQAYVESRAAGEDETAAFLKTGVFEAPDGTLREWIPDTGFNIVDDNVAVRKDPKRGEMFGRTQVRDRFEHPELLDRYPELRDLWVMYREGQAPGEGGLSFKTDPKTGRVIPTQLQIGVGPGGVPADGFLPASMGLRDEMQTPLHELQHAIDILDFGTGGAAVNKMPYDPQLDVRLNDVLSAQEVVRGQATMDQVTPEAARLAESVRMGAVPADALDNAVGRIRNEIYRQQFRAYKENSGEVMARMTERAYETGAQTPADLLKAAPSGPMGLSDVDPAAIWIDKPNQMPRGKYAAREAGDALEAPQSMREGPRQTLPAGAFKEADPQTFDQQLAAARAAMEAAGDKRSALQVDAKLPEDFQGKVYVTDDGLAGFAVSDTGYVSNLFKHPSATYSDVMGAVLQKARAVGGKTLDAFDTGLASGYMKRGAVETGRSPWNPEYAPKGWDEATMGTPDYVSMKIGTTPLKVQPPPDRMAVTSIGTLYDNNVPELPRRANTVVTLAKQFSRTAREVWGRRDMTQFTDRNVNDIGQLLAAETEAAMQREGHAGTWYSDTLDNTHSVADLVYGDVMKEPAKKTAFNFALAITSNGQLVKGNSRLAHRAFQEYLSTGRFPIIGQGKEANAMKHAFRTYNALADSLGEDALQKFLNTEYSVGELKAAGFDIAGEAVDVRVPGAAIFGPKIGGGFFPNLQGDFSRLTADRWLTRTMSRLVGDIYSSNPELLTKQMSTFRKALEKAGQPAPKTDVALKKLAVKLHKAFAKGDETGSYPKSMRSEVNSAARNLAKSLNPAKESPANGTERKYYRAIAAKAVDELKRNGIETTVSDLQALVWYPEQDLYKKLGYRAKPNQERDYLEAFKAIAREAGVTEDQIDGAIRGAGERRASNRGNVDRGDTASSLPAHRQGFGTRQEAGDFLAELMRYGKAPKPPKKKAPPTLEQRQTSLRSLFSD